MAKFDQPKTISRERDTKLTQARAAGAFARKFDRAQRGAADELVGLPRQLLQAPELRKRIARQGHQNARHHDFHQTWQVLLQHFARVTGLAPHAATVGYAGKP